MKLYYFLLRRYNRSWQQVKCFALFVPLLAVLWLGGNVIKHYSTVAYQLFLLAAGWFAWTFIEYMQHRFWLRQPKSSNEASGFVERHQYHHSYPTEIKITPLQQFVLLFILAGLLWLAYKVQNNFLVFVGVYAGFCSYVIMHKVLHQAWAEKVFAKRYRYHLYHHCKFPGACFGVSVTWWDKIFGTTPPSGARLASRIVHFYLHRYGPKAGAT